MDAARLTRRVERERRAREEAERLLEAKSRALFLANQELEALAASLEERVRARTAELQATAQALQAASEAKSEFLARMSHELRTPLNGVLGLVRLARDRVVDPQVDGLLARADASAQSLLGIVGEVLDFSKVEAGRLELERTPFALNGVLAALAPLHAAHPNPDAVELFLRVRPEVPETLVGDPLRLRQALVNLVGNALKFTPRGHVLVEVACLKRDGGRVRLGVTVADTGLGFEPSKAEALFDAFTQADGGTTRQHGGTGLGLPITKGFIEAMGGQITATGAPGEGATFSFDAWFGDPEPLAAMTPVPGRALVVDDAPLARAVVRDALAAMGLQIDEAESGAEAIQHFQDAAARGRAHDVVVLDWRMPGLDGVATLDGLRAAAGGADPQVIMITAAHGPALAEALDGREVSALLTKPVTRSALHDALAHRVARPLPEAAPMRFDGARALVVDNDETNRLVAEGLLGRIGVDVTLSASGPAALALLAGGLDVDLVFLDIRMPGMNGYDCLQALRDRGAPHPPVVMLSADVQPSAMARAEALGAVGFLAKPICPTALQRTLGQFVAPTGGGEHATDDGAWPEVPGVSVADARRRSGEDRVAWQGWMRAFVARHSARVATWRAALAVGDQPTVEAGLHTVRGSAANLGANALAEAVGDAERALHAGEIPDLAPIAAHLAALEDAVAAWDDEAPPEADAGGDWDETVDALRAAAEQAAFVDDDLLATLRALGPDRVGPSRVARVVDAFEAFDFDAAASELADW